MTDSDRSERVQTPRNAWINRVRDEALRMRRPEVSKAVQIGVWIATYADADGSNAFPSQETLAAIATCTDETVTRCVRLLIAVGLLSRKRRPNKSAVYQLLIPTQRPDWNAHLHVWGESRQGRARRKAKEREIAELLAAEKTGPPSSDTTRNPSSDTTRNPSPDGIRNPSPAGVPEPVPGGVPNRPGTRPRTPPDPVRGRIPEPVPGGGDQYIPTSGRDPHTDHETADHSPQPQTPTGTRANHPPDTPDRTGPGWNRCTGCGCHVIQRADKPPRTHCHTCQPTQEAATA